MLLSLSGFCQPGADVGVIGEGLLSGRVKFNFYRQWSSDIEWDGWELLWIRLIGCRSPEVWEKLGFWFNEDCFLLQASFFLSFSDESGVSFLVF